MPAAPRPSFRLLVAAVAAGLLIAPLGASPAAARAAPDSFADLAESLIDSVVNISTSQNAPAADKAVPAPSVPEGSPFEDFFDEFFNKRGPDAPKPRSRKQTSLGSGFVIDPSGVVVTNNHVIDGADEITVNFNDGSKLTAELIGKDVKTDMAVLRVKPPKPLRAVKFGDAERLRVGDWVLAIGNPFGLGGSVSAGIVSARNRNINSGPYDNFIQTDAAINRGNSGGPLFNMAGEVVGINTAIISPSGGSIGIGFSVPSTIAKGVVDQLLSFGETRRGWIGVRIQEVTDDIAESLGVKGPDKGALIAGMNDDGPAAKAGLEAGDVVLRFDGKPVRAMRDLPRIVADTPIDREVEVAVWRKGKEENLRLKVGRLEEGEPKQAALKAPAPEEEPKTGTALGLSFTAITDELRLKFQLKPEAKGLVITEVDDGSKAQENSIQPGDLLIEVAQRTVDNPADVTKRIEELKKDGKKTALLLLANKGGDVRFVALSIE
ncbi:DegQ family serine endoprotease [Hansschlegelia zhihuaiae]|uniref:Probable periplasmic serine endoprotease DegP-like n=1 Tax=Hansschlegelia zhihuaiae TaxID=405005 RepID=A0A4Q0ML16_9HYPH|nr:DegQ family serine endoprotease [Hansschlegelia zhihuaiae]RXF74350.1 DegQ family serine endoprotease [Hansschlegelia zhihuaiae]